VWLLYDNYYVIDQTRGRVLIHKGFRFGGDDFPFLEPGEVYAIGLNCAPKRYKMRQVGWTYTPVLVLNSGQDLELSAWSTDMTCARLPEFNRRVRAWAAALQCYWIYCPPDQEFRAKNRIHLLAAVLAETAPGAA
jgi:hypothetical protein